MPSIDPTKASFRGLSSAVPQGEAVVMLNLLRFRDRAAYKPDWGEPERSGRQAYAEYLHHAVPQIEAIGGRVLWKEKALQSVIAPEGERWDEVLLVEYPSAEAFMAMVRLPAYQAITHHRTAALEDSRLIATQLSGAK